MLSFLNTWENEGLVRLSRFPGVKYKPLHVIKFFCGSFRNYPTLYCYQEVTSDHMIPTNTGYVSMKVPLHLSQKTWIWLTLVSRIEPMKNLYPDFLSDPLHLNQLFCQTSITSWPRFFKINEVKWEYRQTEGTVLILVVITNEMWDVLLL